MSTSPTPTPAVQALINDIVAETTVLANEHNDAVEAAGVTGNDLWGPNVPGITARETLPYATGTVDPTSIPAILAANPIFIKTPFIPKPPTPPPAPAPELVSAGRDGQNLWSLVNAPISQTSPPPTQTPPPIYISVGAFAGHTAQRVLVGWILGPEYLWQIIS